MINILFYKFIEIKNPGAFQKNHLKVCKSLQLKGKVLVAKEGLNGCLSGTDENIQKYKKSLKKDKRFSDIEFKETPAGKHTFKKIFVRVRKEIITSNFKISLNNKAPYVEPKQLKRWFDRNEDMIVLDARNDYESKIGKFKDAITPKMEFFTEWPKIVKKLKIPKDKKIVTYCTGGIRCEKASAYLREQGFPHVYQLHGGILNYGKEVGNDHWQGKCFVFDERGAIDIDPNKHSDPITICRWCRSPSSQYHNCANVKCDKLFISCNSCNEKFDEACSKKCRAIITVSV